MNARNVARLLQPPLRAAVWAAATGALLACLQGCDDRPANAAPAQAPPPRVTVSAPIQKLITEWDDYSGRFAALENVEVRARVGGFLNSVHFRDGEIVRKGQLLFVIDPRPFEATLAQAQGQLEQARSQVVLSERSLARAGELRTQKMVSEQLYDERKQSLDAARAVSATAEAVLRRAQLDLEFTRVVAPTSGRISRHLVSVGNLVSGGDANSSLLATVVSLDPIDFYFEADQNAYLRYARMAKSGERPSSRDAPNPVLLALGDEGEFAHRGRMNFVDNAFDTGTGTMRARARFENPDLLFAPGMFARIRLLGSGEREAMLLPDSAVVTDQSRKVVYVVGPDNVIEMRPVQLGRLVDNLRVIREGLTPADVVVVSGLQRVRVGAPVTPVEQVAANAVRQGAPR
jgi:RND family efflux transporter MFP subunit